MYKSSKLIAVLGAAFVGIINFFFVRLDFGAIAGSVTDFVAITSAVYLGIYPLIQGSERLQQSLSSVDSRLHTRTQIGVLNGYIKCGLITNVVSLAYSLLFMAIDATYPFKDMGSTIDGIISSIGFALTLLNFMFMFWIGKFMVTRVAFNR